MKTAMTDMNMPRMGLNRTGISTSPIQSQEQLADAQTWPPSSNGDEQGIADMRVQYAKEGGEPVGSIPPPSSIKQAVTTMAKALKGENAAIFVDKLSERCAFERQGVRLYDGVISKFEAYGTWEGGPSLEELQHIRSEELQHFELVRDTIEALGGDPTVMSPSANIHGVASMGLVQVITDPRATLLQSLEMVHIAELADNDCWETLAALARSLGHDAVAAKFMECLTHEQDHLHKVRSWLAAAVTAGAGTAVPPPSAH